MIYLLTRKDDVGYDEYDAKVIAAPDEARARSIANINVGDEGRIWGDPEVVTCEIVADNTHGPILESFNAG